MPKPSTFQTIETMTAQVERSASAPNQSDRLVDDAEVDQGPVDEAEVELNSQYQSRLDTPRPMTTGTKTTARVKRRSGVFVGDEQRDQIAADHQDRRDEQRVLQGEAERHPELRVVPGLHEVAGADELLGGVISDQLWSDIHTICDERVGGEDQHEERAPAPGRAARSACRRLRVHPVSAGRRGSAAALRGAAARRAAARRPRSSSTRQAIAFICALRVGDDRVEVGRPCSRPAAASAATDPAAS